MKVLKNNIREILIWIVYLIGVIFIPLEGTSIYIYVIGLIAIRTLSNTHKLFAKVNSYSEKLKKNQYYLRMICFISFAILGIRVKEDKTDDLLSEIAATVFVLTGISIIICELLYFIQKKIENKESKKEEQIATLKIKKIDLNQPLYNKNSEKNNVEENITILEESIMPEEDNSIIFLAAHSGTGPKAYFDDLDQLEINDPIELIYQNKTLLYYVTDIWEEDKNGYIHINKTNNNQLILTTCSPTNSKKQLIISSTEKNTSAT